MLMATNQFRALWTLGYRRLVPVVPPGAPLSENSSLAHRLKPKADGTPGRDDRGKVPGVKNGAGLWRSFDWNAHETDETDLERWHAMGAGVGIKTGAGLVAIDVDTLVHDNARIARDVIEARFGRLPVRVGQYPKALYLARVEGDYERQAFRFGELDERGMPKELIETLYADRFFVAQGIHQKTGNPYEWMRPLVPLDELPTFGAAEVTALMEELRAVSPGAQEMRRERQRDARNVDQEGLRARNAEHVRAALRAIPNDFPDRADYIRVMTAVKAALPDDPEAFDIAAEWAESWSGGDNDHEVVAADWKRISGPFEIGARYLYDLAETRTPGAAISAEHWFDVLPDEDDNPFRAVELNASKATAEEAVMAINPTPYSFVEPSAIPRREWLYGSHYIRSFVSATVAPSGVGKSSLEIVEALAMASGKPLLGVKPRGQFKVWLWNGEDPMDELNRRVAAAMQLHGLTREDVGDRLFVDSGRDVEIVLATETRDGAKISEPVERGLMQAIELNAFDVLQIDPFVSSHRVSENDNNAIDVVAKRWARIADRGRVAVELVHHVRKLNGAEVTVEDGRGASALIAAARPVRAIARMTKQEGARMGLEAVARRLFRFADGKNNLALPADDTAEWFELASQALGNGGGEGVDALMNGDSVGVVRRFVMPDQSALLVADEKGMALRLLASGEWRRDVRAGDAWAGCAVAQALRLDVGDAADMTRAKAVLSGWIKDGTLREVTRKDGNRNMRTFVEVVSAPENQDTLSENGGSSIFD